MVHGQLNFNSVYMNICILMAFHQHLYFNGVSMQHLNLNGIYMEILIVFVYIYISMVSAWTLKFQGCLH